MSMNSYARSWRQAMQDKTVRAEVIRLAKARRPFVNGLLVAVAVVFLVLALGAPLLGAWWIIPAVLLATQARLWAWYLAHDCAHNAAFADKKLNFRVGEWCGFINGLGMFGFADYKKEHSRHHAEKADLLGVRVDSLLARLPAPLSALIVMLERLYLPAMSYLIYAHGMGALVQDPASRRRTLLVLAGYGIFHFLLYMLSPAVLLVWCLSSIFRIHVVRFVDCFQHAYEQLEGAARSEEKRSTDYEVAHTFSIPVAKKFTWLNIIILNFGYHNAHHAVPTCPWYALAEIDRLVLDAMGVSRRAVNAREDTLSLPVLLRHYHRHLEARMLSNQQGYPYDEQGRFSLGRFQGAYTDNLLG